VFGLGWLLTFWRKSKRKSETTLTAQGAKVTDSPVASGSGIVQEVGTTHHHYYGGQHHKQAPLPERERPQPNLEFVGSREKWVFISPFASEGICDPRTADEGDKSVQALVLKFENKVLPDRKIGRALNVIAKIRFLSKERATERQINYGVWLNSPCNSTDIGIGDTCELVLVCVVKNQLISFEDRRTEGHSFRSHFSYIDYASVEELEYVEITLIDKNTQATLQRSFRLWRDGARLCLA